jgi:hypothetical protein
VSISFDIRSLPRPTNSPVDYEARHRAAKAQDLFRENPHRIDFAKANGPAAKIATGSVMDLYADAPGEAGQRAEIARRMDALPIEVAALPKKHAGLALDHLEALAAIRRSYELRGEQPVPVIRGDLARAINVTAERAEAIIRDLEARTLIERHATAGTVPHFRMNLS